MKRTVLILIAMPCALAAQAATQQATQQDQPSKADTAAAPAKKEKANTAAAKAPPPTTIPEGAVKDGNHYRYVDKNGKAWIYRNTPFGVTKALETSAPKSAAPGAAQSPFGTEQNQTATASGTPAAAEDRTANITAVREGEVIHFSKPNPFGASKWDRKVSELTPDEQKIWQREQAKGSQ